MDLLEELTKIHESEELYEMANAIPRDTKLPFTIWLDSVGVSRKNTHYLPRLKVEVDGDRIPVSISKDPQILVDKTIPHFHEIRSFIIRHYEDLMEHWNNEISDREILNRLVETDKDKWYLV